MVGKVTDRSLVVDQIIIKSVFQGPGMSEYNFCLRPPSEQNRPGKDTIEIAVGQNSCDFQVADARHSHS